MAQPVPVPLQAQLHVIDAKGDGTDALVYSGTLKAAGDITFGTWAESTNTFTADET
jgi:hypothetical protein